MKLWSAVKEWTSITLSTAVIAAAVFFFLIPSHLSISSISGLAIILENFLPLSVAGITMVLNILLLVAGFLLIGREFGVKTVYTSLLLPAVMGVLERVFPSQGSLTSDPLIDMLCYCFFVNIGCAALFIRNASSGGLDIVAKLINKYFRVELGHAMSMAGMCISVSAIFVYDLKTVLLSVIGTYLSGVVLDHFIFGSTMKKRVCIISEKEEEIRRFILHELHSGATLYQAIGAYGEQPHTEIITVVDKSEYLRLMNHLAKVDPDAFVTIYAVNEILYKPKAV